MEEERNWELSPRDVSPKVQSLLKEAFFWELVNETSPFGGDFGADARVCFLMWREKNPEKNPMNFVLSEIESYGRQSDYIQVENEEELKSLFADSKLDPFAQDWIIIATAFTQFMIEERIDEEMLKQAVISVRRQSYSSVLEYWMSSVRETRVHKLDIMAKALFQISLQQNDH